MDVTQNVWLSWGDVFSSSLRELWASFVLFTPKLLVAVIFFIIGWVLGSLIAKAFEQVFTAVKVDKLFQTVGAEHFFKKAGMNLNTGYFIGQVAKWFVIILFLLPSLNLLGLTDVSSFLRDNVLELLPRVVIAVLILIIASLVAEAVSKTIVAGARTMNVHSANMLGTVAKYVIWVFAFIIALGQLHVADPYLPILFQVMIGAIGLATALAFGLGGKDHASRLLSRMGDEMRK